MGISLLINYQGLLVVVEITDHPILQKMFFCLFFEIEF
jgi:hypothetical protein